MSVLQKGVLTVISATTVASALILFFGESATAEADNATHSVNTSDIGREPLDNNILTANSSTLQEKVLLKKPLGDVQPQQKKQHKPQLPTNPLSPPPIGPFQAAQPNAFMFSGGTNGSLTTPIVKQGRPTAKVITGQKSQAPMAPVIKRMNQQAPQMPKQISNQLLKPELQTNKLIAPVNRLVKPQAPMLKTPKLFANPPAAPIMQRYMYVPAPVEMHPPVPKTPVAGTYKTAPTTPKIPVNGIGQEK